MDLDAKVEAYCGVRPVPGGVGLALSTKAGQELEVFMSPAEAEQIGNALLEVAKANDG
jgi:hypothetical protein